jgi:hypothetical protein
MRHHVPHSRTWTNHQEISDTGIEFGNHPTTQHYLKSNHKLEDYLLEIGK